MSKTTMTAAFALMLAALLPVYAQTGGSTNAAPAHVTATELQPGQIRTTQMDGAAVYDTHNQKVGDIKDIILDNNSSRPRFTVDMTKDQPEGGPSLRSERQQECP